MNTDKKYKQTIRLYHRMYAIALAAVAIVSLLSQTLIQNYLSNQVSDTHFINYAAKLRTESETLIKYALTLELKIDIRSSFKDYSNTLRRLEKTHSSLIDGNEFLNIPVNKNKEIDELFNIIENPYRDMINAAHVIKDIIEIKPTEYNISQYLPALINAEKIYLLGMEMIVFEYDRQLSNNIRFLKKLEWTLFLILIASLCGEAFLIFLPLSRKLNSSFRDLYDSEKKSSALACELSLVNAQLETSRQEIIKHNDHIQKVRSELIIMGQERERKRIAAEIHDGIGQMLTALKMKIGMLEDADSVNENQYHSVDELLSSIVAETRRICSELLPSVLADFGLNAAIKELINICSKSSDINFCLENNLEESLLSKEQSLAVYRIIQESVNNICKHSDASDVYIILESDAEMIFISISDNGIGFSHDMTNMGELQMMGRSYGLVNMNERAELLGGDLNIKSKSGFGTSVELSIPLTI